MEILYQWRRTELDANDLPTDFDWLGFDGIGYIGRIRKETGAPTVGRWHWAGSAPRTFRRTSPSPNQGCCDTARGDDLLGLVYQWRSGQRSSTEGAVAALKHEVQ